MAKGDIISRLKLESGEFDSKIKRAGQELLAYSEHCRKMGLEMGYANRDAKEFAKQLGSMATVSTTARGKINELSEAFVNAKVMYKNMTDEEKNGEFGKNLAASLDQLKGRLDSAKKDLTDVQKELNGGGSKFGEFGNILDTLGSKMGVTGNLTEMLTSKTAMLTGAVGAGIAIVTKATEAWAGYNAELAKQDQITTVTTGLKGDAADKMTDQARALADTYNVDFREAINAANTLMTQFGESGEQAMQLIKDGMQGMIQGDGPKLLSMIQQYAPAFRDAGVSASQLVAVIQNSEGGIFTDQNMNAIVMGIKNIRLMTDATSQALAKMGIDGEKMSQQLSNGTLTIFDALKQVSHQLQTVDSNSKTAGEVMQQVFGRQGVTAGTNLAKAIETLNTNLDETKRQTGEVGQSLADLQTANERLNTAIRDAFGYDGWDKMAQGIKTKLVGALSDVIEHLAIIEEGFGKLFGRGNNKPKPQKEADYSKFGSYQVTTDSDGNVLKATKWNRGKAIDMTDYERTQQGYTVTGNISKSGSGGGSGGGGTNTPTYKSGSLAAQQAEVQRLTKLWQESGETVRDQYLQPLVDAEKKLQQMKDEMSMQKDMAMGKYSGQGDFKKGLSDAKGVRFNTTLDDMVRDGKDVAKSGTMLLDDKAMAVVTKQIKEATKPQKKEEKSAVEVFGQMNQGINQIVGGIEGLGVTIPEELSGILGGINSMLSVLQGIIILVQGIAAMQEIGTFLGIFHHGGIVGRAASGMLVGTHMSGDNLRMPVFGGGMIGINDGELILNKAQQGIIASQLNGGWDNLNLTATIRGEQIRLAVNNNGKRTGRGEMVQTNRR